MARQPYADVLDVPGNVEKKQNRRHEELRRRFILPSFNTSVPLFHDHSRKRDRVPTDAVQTGCGRACSSHGNLVGFKTVSGFKGGGVGASRETILPVQLGGGGSLKFKALIAAVMT